jgi:hypothetical protein
MPNTGSRWCAAEGEEAGNQTAFAVRLQNKGMDNNTAAGGDAGAVSRSPLRSDRTWTERHAALAGR